MYWHILVRPSSMSVYTDRNTESDSSPVGNVKKKKKKKEPSGEKSAWFGLMQTPPDDALNEPSGGFLMHSCCFSLPLLPAFVSWEHVKRHGGARQLAV